jgi:hypothetical protein
MARGVNIPIGADAKGVITEGKKVKGALEGVIDSLDDVGDESKRTAATTSKSLDSIADEGEASADRLTRSFKESFERVEREAKSSGKTIGKSLSDGVKDGAGDAPLTGEDVFKADLKAELVSNAVEAGSEVARGLKDGFDTEDMSTILDGVSDTVVAVGALGGPVGAAGGLAASAAMQLLIGPVLAEAEADAATFQETFTSAFQAILDSGQALGREATIGAAVNTLVQDQEKLNDATRTATLLGIDRGVVLRAMAGDTDALAIVNGNVTKTQDDLNDATQAYAKVAGDGTVAANNAADKVAQLTSVNRDAQASVKDINHEYGLHNAALDAAAEAATAAGDATNYASEKQIVLAQQTAKSTGKAQELTVTLDGVKKSIEVMPDGKVIEVTDNGTAELTQAEINAISGATVPITVTVDDTLWRNWQPGSKNGSVTITSPSAPSGAYGSNYRAGGPTP